MWGDHYWIIDLEMDCGATREGWFELKTLFSNGGEGGRGRWANRPVTGGWAAPPRCMRDITQADADT